jgi:hypothetical protein
VEHVPREGKYKIFTFVFPAYNGYPDGIHFQFHFSKLFADKSPSHWVRHCSVPYRTQLCNLLPTGYGTAGSLTVHNYAIPFPLGTTLQCPLPYTTMQSPSHWVRHCSVPYRTQLCNRLPTGYDTVVSLTVRHCSVPYRTAL